MNPLDQIVPLAMGWGRPHYGKSYADEQRALLRREALHHAAVARRRKAKRGGKR